SIIATSGRYRAITSHHDETVRTGMATPESERELFNSAMGDEPVDTSTVTAEVEVTTEKSQDADRQRDDKGRFVSADFPQEQAHTETPVEQATEETTQPEQQPERRGEIPAWRLKEEADAKRE